jgi:hypothetical protein
MDPTKTNLKNALEKVLTPTAFEYLLYTRAQIGIQHQTLTSFENKYNSDKIDGREDFLTRQMSKILNKIGIEVESQKVVIDQYGRFKPDLVINESNPSYACEAKSFSLLQGHSKSPGAASFLQYSLSGPVKDLEKLFNHKVPSFHILQFQIELLGVEGDYDSCVRHFGFLKSYLHKTHNAPYLGSFFNNYRTRVLKEDWVGQLERQSRAVLDRNLICDYRDGVLVENKFSVHVRIHFLISAFTLDLTRPLAEQLPVTSMRNE